MIDYIASVVVICGGLLVLVWKLESFIVKRSDKELSELQKEFNATVIKNHFKKIYSSKRSLKIENIEKLRGDLDLPEDLKYERRNSFSGGVLSLIMICLTGALAVVQGLNESFMIGEAPIQFFVFLLALFSILSLFSYGRALWEQRKSVDALEKKIQSSKSLDFSEEEKR